MKARCPYCNKLMDEVAREEDPDCIEIVFHCPSCGKEPTGRYAFEQFETPDGEYIEGRP